MLDYGFQILFSESFAVDDVSDYMYFNVFSLNLTMLHVYPFAYLNRFMYVLKRLVMHGIVAKFHLLLQKRTIVYIFSKILFLNSPDMFFACALWQELAVLTLHVP